MSWSGKGYVLVEGHGEVQAAGNLLARLSTFPWSTPIRWNNLHLEQGLQRGAEFVRGKSDVRALLVLRDEDDACPKSRGPEMAGCENSNSPFRRPWFCCTPNTKYCSCRVSISWLANCLMDALG